MNTRFTPVFDIFEHAKPAVFAAQFFVGLVNSQVSPCSIIMGVSKDFVAEGRRNNQLTEEVTGFPFTRIPKVAKNPVVIEVEIINMKQQGSGYAAVEWQLVGFKIGYEVLEVWIPAL